MSVRAGRLAVLAYVFALSFVFIRVYSGHSVFMLLNAADEGGYFAYTQVAFHTRTFDWCDPRFENSDYDHICRPPAGEKPGKPSNISSPGPALTLLPFTALGFCLNKFGMFSLGTLNADLRFWSVIGTFFLFLGGLLLLFELGLRWGISATQSFFVTAFFALGNPLLYYVFRRPLMAHATEFFWITALLFLCFGRTSLREAWRIALIGAAAAMVLITRLNVGPALGAVPVIVLAQLPTQPRKRLKGLLYLSLGALPFLAIFLLIQYAQRGSFLYSPGSYDPGTFKPENGFWTQFSPIIEWHSYSFRRHFDFWWGPHWGFFWMLPVLWVELIFLVQQRKLLFDLWQKQKLPILGVGFFLFLQLNLMANYPCNGISFGYRYLFFPLCGLHALFLYCFGKTKGKLKRTRLWLAAASICGVVASFHVINFESNATTLTLTPQRQVLEGIFQDDWRERVRLIAPEYVRHSSGHILRGAAFKNLVASPAAAYTLFAWKAAAGPDLIARPLSYYESPKRGIYGFRDLWLLALYQLVFLAMLLFLAGLTGMLSSGKKAK